MKLLSKKRDSIDEANSNKPTKLQKVENNPNSSTNTNANTNVNKSNNKNNFNKMNEKKSKLQQK